MIEQGDTQEAARLIDARLAADAAAGQLWNAAELLRIKSRTLADKPKPRAQKSAILRRALALARAQKAKAWESRLAAD
jgi:chromatin segregation and condensation protein Rec8/ScpA/Scc1 (kleisin family)